MLALLRAVATALKSAILWIAEMMWGICMAPLRALAPPSGRAAVPHAPVRPSVSAPSVSPQPGEPAVRFEAAPASRVAADVIRWLSQRQRQGSGAGNPPSTLPADVRNWAYALDDDAARRTISSGFSRLSEHLAGACLIEGLPATKAHGREPSAARRRAAALLRPREIQSPASASL